MRENEITFEVVNGVFFITDEYLGRRPVPETELGLIVDQLKVLKKMDENLPYKRSRAIAIEVYEYILRQPDSERTASLYFETRKKLHGEGILSGNHQLDVARHLGWPIPGVH